MRLVVQRVSSASVTVAGVVRGEIGRGLLVLVGFAEGDSERQLGWAADKVSGLRVFEEGEGKMNLGVREVGGGILLVPNFTLCGEAQKGRRPSFDKALRPEAAEPMFEALARLIKERGVPVATGVFRAEMKVAMVNEGPITLVIEAPGA